MNKHDICNELDKLKLKIMTNGMKSSDEFLYDEWVDELLCRKPHNCMGYHGIGCPDLCNPKEYTEYKTINSYVDQLFYEKHGDKKEYHKYQPEIRKIISEVVAMTLFYKKRV